MYSINGRILRVWEAENDRARKTIAMASVQFMDREARSGMSWQERSGTSKKKCCTEILIWHGNHKHSNALKSLIKHDVARETKEDRSWAAGYRQ